MLHIEGEANAVDRVSIDVDRRLEERGEEAVPGVLTADAAGLGLEAWLDEPRLTGALDAYFGVGAWDRGDFKALRLTGKMADVRRGPPSLDGYISAYWHHDRCGTRVKAFFFLHDVTRESRPTAAARGSHRTLYYDHASLEVSRFADAYVAKSYDVATLVGPKGGGFLLDTNAVHRGETSGKWNRTVAVADFVAKRKKRAFADLGYRGPCGQDRQRKARHGGGGTTRRLQEKRHHSRANDTEGRRRHSHDGAQAAGANDTEYIDPDPPIWTVAGHPWPPRLTPEDMRARVDERPRRRRRLPPLLRRRRFRPSGRGGSRGLRRAPKHGLAPEGEPRGEERS